MNEKLDRKLMRTAYLRAHCSSTDPSTQNGAILWNPFSKMIMIEAANHFPDGVMESDARWERPLKYSYVEHAERNAIFKAARYGIQTTGFIMYVPWFACADCARAIIQSGIEEVVGHKDVNDKMLAEHPAWEDTVNIAYGMLTEAGIKFRHIEGKLFEDPDSFISVRFNGRLWTP